MIFAWLLVAATQVIHLEGPDDFDQGTFDGTALTRQGKLVAAEAYERARSLDGVVLTALGDGRLLLGSPLRLIKPGGEVELSDAERSAGNACAGRAGTYVSAMPGGLLRFRARGAKTWQVVALPSSHRSIWGVACTRRGALIATAQPAALYRLSGAKVVAKVKVPSEGLRSVTSVGDDVFAGGLTDGRVWRWRGQALTVVHVAPHPEVKELLAAPPGRLIVLSIGDAADDAADLPEPRPGSAGSGAVESLKLESLMAETLWRGSGSTPTDALLTTNDLWVVTDAGRLHRIDVSDDAVGVRRRHRRSSIADGRPIEAIWQHKKQLVLYGGGWELRPGRARHRYRSPVLDAGGRLAHWGALRADDQAIRSVRWRFGQDPSLKGWTGWQETPGAVARYAQFELELNATAEVAHLEQFVRAVNGAPDMISVSALAPSTRLEAKPVDLQHEKGVTLPDDDLEDYQVGAARERPAARARMTRVHGYRSVTWKAEDPEDDPLVFEVRLHELTAKGPRLIRAWQQTLHYTTLATSALRHGVYQVEVRVRDGQSEWSRPATTRSFLNDLRAPTLQLVRDGRAQGRLRLKVSDDDFTVAVVCGDQERRVELLPSDGVADSRTEHFVLPEKSWVKELNLERCEAIDASGNRRGIDLPSDGAR